MASANSVAFGTLLRRFRIACGLTQEELAERAGLSVRGISDLERGLSKTPRLITLRLLMEALRLSADDRASLQAVAHRPGNLLDVREPQDEDLPGADSSDRRQQSLPVGGFLGSLPSGPFVAREKELGRILTTVERVTAGAGRLVMLTGEPGVGKTRLAQEVTLHLHNRGFLIAAGRSYEPEQAVPYHPFREALSHLYAVCPTRLLQDVPSRWPYLSRLIPDEEVKPPTAGLDAQEDQQRLFRALTGFLTAVSESAPIAVLVDDLQWADRSSLGLLLHLVRHTYSSPLLILGTYRDVELRAQPPLTAALRDLEREQLVETVPLASMGPSDTTALIAATLGTWISQEFAELVHRRTDGNPFFVQQLLQVLVERGDIYRYEGEWARRAIDEIQVPETLRSVILHRVSYLSGQTQGILHEASVLGQAFTFDELQGMSGRAEAELEDALDEAMRAALLRDAGTDEYGFDHALTQQVLYQELPTRRKRHLHVAAGGTLERSPIRDHPSAMSRYSAPGPRHEGSHQGSAARLAWHFLQGRDHRRALDYCIVAGDQAETVFAHDDAERHYQTALSLAARLQDAGREAQVLEKLGGVVQTVGRYEAALELLETAAERFRVMNDSEGERRSVAQIGQTHFSRGSFQEGIDRLLGALTSLDGSSPSHGLAALHAALAYLFFRSGRYREQLAAAERASELARAIGSDRLQIRAELVRGYALLWTERRADFRPVMESVAAQGEKIGDLSTVALAYSALVSSCADSGELQQAREYAERALEIHQRQGDPSRLAFATYVRGLVAYWSGNWDGAQTDFERSLELYREVGSEEHSMIPIFGLGALHMGRGESQLASRYLEEHMATARRSGDLRWFYLAVVLLAESELLEGRAKAARARLQQALDSPGLKEETDAAEVRAALAWAWLELGDATRAAKLVTEAIRLAEQGGYRRVLLEALRIRGMVMTRQRRWEEGRRSFEGVLALTDRSTYPYARARALLEYAKMLIQQDDRRQAQARLREALEVFEGLGDRKDVERTQQALALIDQR
jgi:tetratricopeptide (TPR) repeat protein/transcriptional regulator with XRE-family HTH domain